LISVFGFLHQGKNSSFFTAFLYKGDFHTLFLLLGRLSVKLLLLLFTEYSILESFLAQISKARLSIFNIAPIFSSLLSTDFQPFREIKDWVLGLKY